MEHLTRLNEVKSNLIQSYGTDLLKLDLIGLLFKPISSPLIIRYNAFSFYSSLYFFLQVK